MSVTQNFTVTGMTCGHCLLSVREEVEEIPGVVAVDVLLENGSLTITSTKPIADDAVRTAVQDAGYQLT